MKKIDVSKKHRVTLTFLLDEEVTPQLFAEKIARACSGGALRPGEAVSVFGTDVALFVTDETLSLPSFGHELYSTRKMPRRRPKAGQKRQRRSA